MAAPISFQGLSTKLPTDQLIGAMISQESQPMVRMQAKQTNNNLKSAALTSLNGELNGLSSSMASLGEAGFKARKVASSDANGTNVTATANGATPGSYDVTVGNVATRSRMVVPASVGVDAGEGVGTGTYSLTDMNGTKVNIAISDGNNTLTGLRDAINTAQDAKGNPINVNATIIQSGTDGKSQLVLSSKNTGTGSKGAESFSLAGPGSNNLGLSSMEPLTSSAALNAHFTLNGVAMERTSNTVSDAVPGMTFNLQAGDPTKTTTLNVSIDKTAITAAMQDVVNKFNGFYQDYKSKTTSTTAADGTITSGVFNNEFSIRTIVSQVHNALMGSVAGISPNAPFNSAASVGLKTNRDGTLSLDTGAFQAALDKDATGVANVFNTTGSSSSPLLTFQGATTATTTAPISFNVGQPDAQGGLSAQFSIAAPGGGLPITSTLTSSNGLFHGAAGTPFEGLAVEASAGATGTLNVSRGLSQNLGDLVKSLTSSSSGNIGSIVQNIGAENHNLTQQIATQQSRLDRRKSELQKTYANLETTVGQLQAAGQSVSSM